MTTSHDQCEHLENGSHQPFELRLQVDEGSVSMSLGIMAT
ncbi:hypothetical protein BN2537_2503 [Streptomyces venezuelae]|nr:hypothetical protein BN2537_2503 [Streptomyces venezuelae]